MPCGTLPFHPIIVPSSVQNKNDAAFEVPGTTNDGDAMLKSTPVTAPIAFAPVLAGAGIVTTKLIAAPLVPYSVEVPLALFPIQKGLPPLKPLPHGFTRLGSV